MKPNGVRHFLDLVDIRGKDLRGMVEASRAMKDRSKRGGSAGDRKSVV